MIPSQERFDAHTGAEFCSGGPGESKRIRLILSGLACCSEQLGGESTFG